MSTTTPTTPPATTTAEFDAVYRRLIRWRRWMIRRYERFEDIAEIIDESLWAQHLAGVTNDQKLTRTAENAVRRHIRAESRVWDLYQRLSEAVQDLPDPFEERVVESVAASECVRRLDIPPRAWTWLQRDQQPGTLSAADESYGRRWAARTRKGLAHVA
jgi:hypothetical protein